jgi:hypothetical protein
MRLNAYKKILPKATEIRKTLKSKQKQLEALSKEIDVLLGQVLALEDVVNYGGHPIMFTENDSGATITSAADDVVRYAVYGEDDSNGGYFVEAYRSSAVLPLYRKQGLSGKQALRMAKDFVADIKDDASVTKKPTTQAAIA